MAAARALALAAGQRRAAAASRLVPVARAPLTAAALLQGPDDLAVPLLRQPAPPLGGRSALTAAALLQGRDGLAVPLLRQPAPPLGGRSGLTAALQAPRSHLLLGVGAGGSVACLRLAPLLPALGPRRLLYTGATIPPAGDGDKLKRAAFAAAARARPRSHQLSLLPATSLALCLSTGGSIQPGAENAAAGITSEGLKSEPFAADRAINPAGDEVEEGGASDLASGCGSLPLHAAGAVQSAAARSIRPDAAVVMDGPNNGSFKLEAGAKKTGRTNHSAGEEDEPLDCRNVHQMIREFRKENNYRRSTQTLYICFVIFLKMVIIVLVIFAYGVSHAVESARDKKEEDGKEEEEEERAGGRGKE